MSVELHLVGIHSRSKKHVSVSRDFDRNRISAAEYLAVQEREAKALAEEQRQNGFSFISDGQFLWMDLFRPFAESPGLRVGPLTRWFETNTFYKKPVAENERWAEGFEAGFLEKYFFWSCNPTLVFLPGPFSFSRLAESVSIENAALVLRKASLFLEKKGVKRIVFSEPSLGYEAQSLDSKSVRDIETAFKTLSEITSVEKILLVYYGPCPQESFSLPVDGIALDLFEEQESLKAFPENKTLGLGVVDATNTLLEEKSDAVEKARKALGASGAQDFFLCPNQAFDFIPRSFASGKMGVLKETAGELGGK